MRGGRQRQFPGQRVALAVLWGAASVMTAAPVWGAEDLEFLAWRMPTAIGGIAQDADGWIRMGMTGGVGRFDGRTIGSGVRVPPGGESFAQGLTIAATSDGAVWVGLGQRPEQPDANYLVQVKPPEPRVGLARIVGRTVHWVGAQEGMRDVVVWRLHVSIDDTLWVGTEQGAARREAGGFHWYGPESGLPGRVLAIASSDPLTPWFGTSAGLFHLAEGTIRSTEIVTAVQSLAVGEDGTVWAGTSDGLFAVQGGKVLRHLQRDDGLPGNDIRALLAASDGGLWIGTTTGLARMRGDQIDVIPALSTAHSIRSDEFAYVDGIAGSWITVLHQDREGSVWVGARNGGITRVRRARARNLEISPGHPGPALAIGRTQDRQVWVSTPDGLVRLRDGKPEGSPVVTVGGPARFLAPARSGGLWVGGLVGIFHLDSVGQLRPIAADALRTRVGALGEDATGGLWLGTEAGDVWYFSSAARMDFTQGVRHFSVSDGACAAPVISAMVLGPDEAWFGSDGRGVTHVKAGKVRCLDAGAGFPPVSVTSMAHRPSGDLWFALAPDAGLVRLRNGRLARVEERAGLRFDSIAQLIDDGAGNAWTIAGGGVARMPWRDLDAIADGRSVLLAPVSYDAVTGMVGQQAPFGTGAAAIIADDGALWTTHTRGVTVIFRPEDETPRAQPRAAFSGIQVDGRPVPLSTGLLRLSGSAPTIELNYFAATFLEEGRLWFRHRFDGGPWRRTQQRSIRFEAVAPGGHIVTLESSDGYGGWSGKPSVLQFVVVTPFHRSIWFLGLLSLLSALIVLALQRFRIIRMKSRQASINAERARIAGELHDSVGQTFVSLRLLLDALRENFDKGTSPELADERKLLAGATQVLEYSNAALRARLWDLRSDGVERIALSVAIENVLRRLRAGIPAGGPEILLRCAGGDSSVPQWLHELPPLVEEAVSNAIRHARARRIEVELALDQDGLDVLIRDDGMGVARPLDELEREAHFGIPGMRERARRLNGTFDLQPNPDGGTVIRVRLPMYPAQRGSQ